MKASRMWAALLCLMSLTASAVSGPSKAASSGEACPMQVARVGDRTPRCSRARTAHSTISPGPTTSGGWGEVRASLRL